MINREKKLTLNEALRFCKFYKKMPDREEFLLLITPESLGFTKSTVYLEDYITNFIKRLDKLSIEEIEHLIVVSFETEFGRLFEKFITLFVLYLSMHSELIEEYPEYLI